MKHQLSLFKLGNANSNLGVLDVQFDENGVIVGHAGELIAIGDQAEDPRSSSIV